jgi:hypothetical protein
MGLLVVARLAVRHGIRVRLNPAELGGLTALVWFPNEILTHYGAAVDPGQATAEQRGAAVSPPAYASARMNTQDVLATRSDPAWSARSAQATVPVEPAAALRHSGSGRPDVPGGDVGIVMPQAESQARTRGLPIFDEVESRWSTGGREAPGPAPAASPAPPAAGRGSSPADEGWPASQAADSSSRATAARLPRRPASANQGTGVIAGATPFAPDRFAPPDRSAAPDRDRLAGFQRGVSEGRAAPGPAVNPGGQGQDES